MIVTDSEPLRRQRPRNPRLQTPEAPPPLPSTDEVRRHVERKSGSEVWIGYDRLGFHVSSDLHGGTTLPSEGTIQASHKDAYTTWAPVSRYLSLTAGLCTSVVAME